MDFRFDIIACRSFKEIQARLTRVLQDYKDLFPRQKDGLILLKPNLNSNMNALTGNTTDLRILSALIRILKDEGYTNVMIGEGTNSGFYRNNISVISRLGVDRLAQHMKVPVRDLNRSDPHEIHFDKGVKAHVAKEVVDAKMIINLPKLKTHFENGMTVCLKNLMGCLVGQENKKKVHDNLPVNILKINEAVKPQLHIVDALIAMEGLGPTKGVPVRLDRILVGTNPFLIDLACAAMARFDYRKVRTLALAQERGILTQAYFDFVDTLDLSTDHGPFAPPKAGPLATFIHDPRRQKFFLKIRNTPFFNYLASTDWFAKFLFLTDLRQDVFLFEEMSCNALTVDTAVCDGCGVCRDICPVGLDLPGDLEKDNPCIECMYCYSVCPKQAIGFDGTPGFFEEQINQYDEKIRALYAKRGG